MDDDLFYNILNLSIFKPSILDLFGTSKVITRALS